MNGNSSLTFLGLTKNQFALAVLGFMVAGAVLWSLLIMHVQDVAESNNRSLCAAREYYEEAAEASEQFLREHPGPEPIEGVTRAQLQRSHERQLALVNALRHVECPPSGPAKPVQRDRE